MATSPVPKTLLSATGKRMSIRELYNCYDGDGNGSIDRYELRRFIMDLELVQGLSDEEAATVIDSYCDRADVNGDGDISFAEFAKLHSELKVGADG